MAVVLKTMSYSVLAPVEVVTDTVLETESKEYPVTVVCRVTFHDGSWLRHGRWPARGCEEPRHGFGDQLHASLDAEPVLALDGGILAIGIVDHRFGQGLVEESGSSCFSI
jgi:hypothetical protein